MNTRHHWLSLISSHFLKIQNPRIGEVKTSIPNPCPKQYKQFFFKLQLPITEIRYFFRKKKYILLNREERIKYATKGVKQVERFYGDRLDTCPDFHLTQIYLARANDKNKNNAGKNVALAKTGNDNNNVVILAPMKHHMEGSK